MDRVGSPPRSSLTAFFNQLATAPQSLLMLDYDGTLSPFQTQRHRAFPYPGVLGLLQGIAQCESSRVIIITGRPIDELQPLIAPLCNIEIYGSYGLEHLLPSGTYSHDPVAPELAASLIRAQSCLAVTGLGHRAEVKPGGIAIHWRGLPAKVIDEIQIYAQTALADFAKMSGLIMFEFDGGLELRVAHPNKEDIVISVLEGSNSNIAVAYLGDDIADEGSFRILQSRGLTGLVRPEYRDTDAQFWMRPPDDLIAFLQQWLECIQSVRTMS